VKCTVLAGADRATKAIGLLEMDSVFLVVDRARPAFDHSLFPCEICQEKKEKENYASSKKLLTSIKEMEPLGKKSPFTRNEICQVWTRKQY